MRTMLRVLKCIWNFLLLVFASLGRFFMDPDPDFRIQIQIFADLDPNSGKKILSGSGSRQKDPNPEHCLFK